MDDSGYDIPAVKDEEKSFIERENDYDAEDGQLAVDVFQNDNEVIIQSIVAGVKPDDLDISIDKNSVTIRGKRENNRLTKRENAVCQELYWGGFSRTVSLSDEMDSETRKPLLKTAS